MPAWLGAQIDKEEKTAGLPQVLTTLTSPNAESRRGAIEQLAAAAKAGISMEGALPALAAALADADITVRRTAAEIIGA